jgi:hypothetical protein
MRAPPERVEMGIAANCFSSSEASVAGLMGSIGLPDRRALGNHAVLRVRFDSLLRH